MHIEYELQEVVPLDKAYDKLMENNLEDTIKGLIYFAIGSKAPKYSNLAQ